jgi:hypothetical protein
MLALFASLHGPLCIRKGVPGLTITYLFPNMVSSCYFTSDSFDKTNRDLYYKMKYNNVGRPIIIGFNCAQGGFDYMKCCETGCEKLR